MLRVNNLVGFGSRPLDPINVVSIGIDANSSGASPINFTSRVSTGDYSIVVVGCWRNGNSRTFTSGTWNGNALTVLASNEKPTGDYVGSLILGVDGAQSGTVALTFSGALDQCAINTFGLTGLLSSTSLDTDTSTGTASSGTLSSLTSPGAGGIRIASVGLKENTSDPTSWNAEATEAADLWPLATAYELGDSSTSFVDTFNASSLFYMCGVSLR